MILTNFDFQSTQGWLGVFWSIWPEMTLQVLRCLNRLHHANLDVSTAPWKKDNIFGIFGVWHANQRQTKYDVYTFIYAFHWFLVSSL